MARTKHTAKKSTGAPAPRMPLGTTDVSVTPAITGTETAAAGRTSQRLLGLKASDAKTSKNDEKDQVRGIYQLDVYHD